LICQEIKLLNDKTSFQYKAILECYFIHLDDHHERRSRSRSPIAGNILDVVGGDEDNPSRRVPGVRGRSVYMATNGYTYHQNHTSANRRLVIQFCKLIEF